jgi:hypothetical protein
MARTGDDWSAQDVVHDISFSWRDSWSGLSWRSFTGPSRGSASPAFFSPAEQPARPPRRMAAAAILARSDATEVSDLIVRLVEDRRHIVQLVEDGECERFMEDMLDGAGVSAPLASLVNRGTPAPFESTVAHDTVDTNVAGALAVVAVANASIYKQFRRNRWRSFKLRRLLANGR